MNCIFCFLFCSKKKIALTKCFLKFYFFFKAHHEKKIIVGDYAIPTGFYYLYLSLICQLTRFERRCSAVALICQILLKHFIAVSFLKTCIMVTKMNNSVLSVALKILFDLYPLFHSWNFFWQSIKQVFIKTFRTPP